MSKINNLQCDSIVYYVKFKILIALVVFTVFVRNENLINQSIFKIFLLGEKMLFHGQTFLPIFTVKNAINQYLNFYSIGSISHKRSVTQDFLLR